MKTIFNFWCKRKNQQKKFSSIKFFFHLLIILVFLQTLQILIVSCSSGSSGGSTIITDPTDVPGPTNTNMSDIPIERPLHIVSIPESSITKTVSIDTDILDLYLSSGYNADDFSITHLDGVDVGIIDTNALNINLEDKTLIGTIVLRQRLDFENPTDGGEDAADNDYEVAIFRVMSETSSNDFKLIVRITDAPDSKKLEILIDSFHLDDVNQQRGIRELYLYEDSGAMDPLMGSDSNNFLTANLVEDTSFLGDVDASTDLTKLYDQDDGVDAFLTGPSINSNSKTYHRISLDFTEEVNIQKVAIRGRQIGGYYGFVFILRDQNDHIIYAHQVQNSIARGSGSENSATSTYAFVPDYAGFVTITNFGITLDNMYFDIGENTTNVFLIDNFSVARGYEYERGFVSIDPGVDFDKFNTDDLYFLDNELVGLSFKNPPDAENHQDVNRDGLYELGTVIITNVDGGRLTFSLPVEVINIPTTISLTSNVVSYTLSIYTSNIIADLTEVVTPSNFENTLNLGQGTYTYDLAGADAGYFRIVGNTVKTTGPFGFSNIFHNDGVYHFQVRYTTDGGVANATLNVTVRLNFYWQEINSSAPWSARRDFQTVVLANDELLLMGGHNGTSRLNDIWMSDDRGRNWSQVTSSAGWSARNSFQALAVSDQVIDNRVVIIGGATNGEAARQVWVSDNMGGYYLVWQGGNITHEMWISDDGGTNWSLIDTAPNPTGDSPHSNYYSRHARRDFQAVALGFDDYVSVGGTKATDYTGYDISRIYYVSTNYVWDPGLDWREVEEEEVLHRASVQYWVYGADDDRSTLYLPGYVFENGRRRDFQAVNLSGNNILVMGGVMVHDSNAIKQDIWMTSNKGASWSRIPAMNHWGAREKFQAVAFPSDEIFVLGGYSGGTFLNDVWVSSDKGTTWNELNNFTNHWSARRSFQTVRVGNDIVVMGGYDGANYLNDVWTLKDIYNKHYLSD